jgi:hypothetical protein
MMLVRTEAGYEPVPMTADQYIWDQPLHPERENTIPSSPPPAPVVHEEPPPSSHNGNGNGHAPEPVTPEPVTSEPQAELREPPAPSASSLEIHAAEERVTVSKKAVAVGIALALGLPLGGKVLSLGDRAPQAPAAAQARAASGPIRPLALAPTRSGFAQVSPDAARFAVIVRNPNRRLAARDTDVLVTFHDRSGGLIGSAVERLSSVPAGGAIAFAGQAGVAGTVASLRTRVSVAGFTPPTEAVPFVVRGTTVTRSRGALVVRTAVGAKRRVRDARVVVVYFDRKGRILGGDFGYVDVPSMPRLASAAVSTSGVAGSVHRVEVYVLDPR